MGRLHKIKRRFNKLSSKQRKDISEKINYCYGVSLSKEGLYPTYWRQSHRMYIKKLLHPPPAQ